MVRLNGYWITFYCGGSDVKRKTEDTCITNDFNELERYMYIADFFKNGK